MRAVAVSTSWQADRQHFCSEQAEELSQQLKQTELFVRIWLMICDYHIQLYQSGRLKLKYRWTFSKEYLIFSLYDCHQKSMFDGWTASEPQHPTSDHPKQSGILCNVTRDWYAEKIIQVSLGSFLSCSVIKVAISLSLWQHVEIWLILWSTFTCLNITKTTTT